MPFYFDLANRGFAGDAAAREFVVAQRKELGGRGVPTPPLLLMTPGGKVLGEVSNYASADKVLGVMRRVLAEHPEYNRPGEDEKRVEDALGRARILIDLLDYEGARKALAGSKDAAARYVLGRLARRDGDWKSMEKQFSGIDDAGLKDDMRVERAYRFWVGGKFKELRDHLDGFPSKSNRYSEARYLEGLALFHVGSKDKALEVWKSTIQGCTQDPWIYRADWAYCNAKQAGKRRSFSTRGPRTSLLNRIGYMGRRNPDLEKR